MPDACFVFIRLLNKEKEPKCEVEERWGPNFPKGFAKYSYGHLFLKLKTVDMNNQAMYGCILLTFLWLHCACQDLNPFSMMIRWWNVHA